MYVDDKDEKPQDAGVTPEDNSEEKPPENTLEDVPFEKGKLPETDPSESATTEEFVNALYGVPIKVTAILGSTRMSIEHLLKLGRGAVIQLNKQGRL